MTAEERASVIEQCAKVCEEQGRQWMPHKLSVPLTDDCAAAIRALKHPESAAREDIAMTDEIERIVLLAFEPHRDGPWTASRICAIAAEAVRKALSATREDARDARRLDWLDKINAEKNKRHGTTYGWKLSENHNRIALEDHGFPPLSVRSAIDKAMQPAALDSGEGR